MIQSHTSVQKFYVLLCGYEIIPRHISIRGGGGRILLAEPICAYVVQTETGWILFDTGVNGERTNDPALAQQYFTNKGWTTPPIVRPEHSLVLQLAQLGIQPSDIHQVVLSHLHADHTGYLHLFLHASIYIQRNELDYALSHPGELGWIEEDYMIPELNWQLLDGDAELAPGISIISTPGHTAGHQSAVIKLPSGSKLILTFDAGDMLENFEFEILPGHSFNDVKALQSILKLKALASEPGSKLFLFHDPTFIQTVKLAPEYYE